MLKKTITYTDFNGDERTEDFYFNLTKSELIEMELSGPNNSFQESMQKIIDSKNGRIIMQEFRKLLGKAYGERSEDGRLFLKSEEILQRFEGSGAYDVFFTELVTDADAAAVWVRGVVPTDLKTDGASTTPEKSPSQIARERSEAQLQGHRPKQPAEPQTVQAPVEPETPPAAEKPLTEEEIDALDVPDFVKDRLRNS